MGNSSQFQLIASLNDAVFSHSQLNLFPLKISIDTDGLPEKTADLLKWLDKNSLSYDKLDKRIHVQFTRKLTACEITKSLLQNWPVSFDYSAFISHPGAIFVKNATRPLPTPLSERDFRSFFVSASPYRSNTSINILNSEKDSALLRFENFLDAEHWLNHPDPSPFYINRYISRKERTALSPLPSSSVLPEENAVYETIVVENLAEFFGPKPSLDTLSAVLVKKLALFAPISSVYFPVLSNTTDELRFCLVGFVNFAPSKTTSVNVLKALYFLDGLDFDALSSFSEEDIHDLLLGEQKPPPETSGIQLRLSIAQKKHNYHLYDNMDSFYVSLLENGSLGVLQPESPAVHCQKIVDKLAKSSNFQETNVYVNNFPVVFDNNDQLWSAFWDQFGVGGIKSAKIIKPQFYSKKSDDSLGRIGFVFYEDFKMALRAIIMTNNRTIKFGDHPNVLIQASFAIQKKSFAQSSHPKSASSKNHSSSYSGPSYTFYSHPESASGKRRFSEPAFFGNQMKGSPYLPPEAYYYYPYFLPMQPPGPIPVPLNRSEKDKDASDSDGQFPHPLNFYCLPYYSMTLIPPQMPYPVAFGADAPHMANQQVTEKKQLQ